MNKKNKEEENLFRYKTESENTGFLFLQLSNLWGQQQERFIRRYFDMSHTQYAILVSTYWLTYCKVKEVTQSELAKHSKLEKMTLSKNVQYLKTMGYVDIVAHSTDTRANSVIITEAGQNFLKRAVPMIEDWDIKFFKASCKNLKSFNEILAKLIEANDLTYLR
jgi:DNA-binding MarR family transcriptional regulator